MIPNDKIEDCQIIQKLLIKKGYSQATTYDAYGMWLDFSESYAAGWLGLPEPEDEDELWHCIERYNNLKRDNHYGRVTPPLIKELKENEVFVFGSNLAGRHGAGAAKQAMKWGAVYGVGVGLRGRTYAIPTKNHSISPHPLDMMTCDINEFILFAHHNPHLTFLLTEIGCGLAGYKPEQIAPMFRAAKFIENIHLPQSFWQVILKEMPEKKAKTIVPLYIKNLLLEGQNIPSEQRFIIETFIEQNPEYNPFQTKE